MVSKLHTTFERATAVLRKKSAFSGRGMFALCVSTLLITGCAGGSSTFQDLTASKPAAPAQPQIAQNQELQTQQKPEQTLAMQENSAATPAAEPAPVQTQVAAATEVSPSDTVSRSESQYADIAIGSSLPQPDNTTGLRNGQPSSLTQQQQILLGQKLEQQAELAAQPQTPQPAAKQQELALWNPLKPDTSQTPGVSSATANGATADVASASGTVDTSKPVAKADATSSIENIRNSALALLDGDPETGGIALGTPSTPVIDPVEFAAQQRIATLHSSIKHGKCNSAWAPKPKRLEAQRINPGDPYYVEFRMRNTPLMPVGHTFIVYGNLDGNGQPLTEYMAMLAPRDGYTGATLAAAVPVPGTLMPYGDDCRLRPETSYRVSLNAQKYEKLLRELKKAKSKKPIYMLFANNCNHFTQRMADAVGIKPPRNKYVPAVDYLYDMIEANEGIKIDTRFRSKVAGLPDWPEPAYVKQQRIKMGWR